MPKSRFFYSNKIKMLKKIICVSRRTSCGKRDKDAQRLSSQFYQKIQDGYADSTFFALFLEVLKSSRAVLDGRFIL